MNELGISLPPKDSGQTLGEILITFVTQTATALRKTS